MTSTESETRTFLSSFTGRAMLPGQPDYDRSRAVWNGAIDRKPAVIACCTTAEQVADAIRFARGSGLEIAVRGGGHNYAGHAVCDGGLMIHLGAMNGVAVDPAARRAVCGGGATWADVDAATQQHGLATPGGFISHTGIAGLTLGGGIGWLTKKAGLSCDNLVAAEVVTADSRIVRASKDENPDLFWALRGGGGNFGVVTSFEFALHPVGPLVNLGLFFFGLENGPEALRFARDFIKTLPPEATAFLGDRPERAARAVRARSSTGSGPGTRCWSWASDRPRSTRAIVAPIREAVTPLFELVTPIPFVALQQMFNESATWGMLGYEKALYLDELSDAAIAVIGEHVPKKSSPLSFCPTFTPDRRLPDARRRRHRLRRKPLRGLRVQHRRRRAPIARCTRPIGRGCATSGTRCGRTRRGSGGYVNFMVGSRRGPRARLVRRRQVRSGWRASRRIRPRQRLSPQRQHQTGSPAGPPPLTARLIYTAMASVDGYIEDTQGKFHWAAPDEEVHQFVNDLLRPVGTYLYGRRMYETMKGWETEYGGPSAGRVERDFANLWRAADKVVYSRTLSQVATPRTRLERTFEVDAIRAMKAGARSDLGIGGPDLAAHAFRAGLIDEIHLFLAPIIVGGGKQSLPDDVRMKLTLVDQRRFDRSSVAYLRYTAVR